MDALPFHLQIRRQKPQLEYSMFGVKPGMTFEEGKKIIRQAGFSEHALPFTFNANKYSLTFLVDSNNKIFGLTLESLD